MAQLCSIHVDDDIIFVGVLKGDTYYSSVFEKRFRRGMTALEFIGYIVDCTKDVLERDLEKAEANILVQAISDRIHQWCD